jgi:hypothetical protein
VPGGEIWLTDQSYKFVLNDANNVLIATYDNIFAIPPVSALDAATTPLAGSEILSIVQSGSTVKVSVANLTAGRAISASAATISGNVLVGATSTRSVGNSFQNTTSSQIFNELKATDLAAFTTVLNRNDSNSARMVFGKSRGTTAGSVTTVQANDNLGSMYWAGADGTSLNPIAAAIDVAVDGTPGLNDMPGRMVFSTTADGASTPTERMRITSSGDVGIGTNSPGASLHVAGAIASNPTGNGVLLGTAGGYSFIRLNEVTGGIIDFSTSGTAFKGRIEYLDANNTMSFFTGGIERMSVSGTDGILLSRSTPIAGIGSSVSVSYVPNSGHGITLKAESTVFTYNAIRFLNIADGVSGTITQTTSTVAYNTSSDYRLKENVLPMMGALAKVAALKPVTYTWKVDGSAGQGFIAHELQEVVPDCVTGTKDAVDENGNIRPQGVDTSFLVATLTAAIQEQQAMIVQLQADVAALKSTN